MKTGVIVQTRMGSTRLPGKVMMDLCGKPVIDHVIDRLKRSRLSDEIIIATTTLERDKVVVEQAKKNGVKWFCGSEDDVLSRYYCAAKENDLDVVVRVTSDCPLIDPVILDNVVDFYMSNNYTLVTNAGINFEQRTFPRGLDVEVFSFSMLDTPLIMLKKVIRESMLRLIYMKHILTVSTIIKMMLIILISGGLWIPMKIMH